ncbi:hypothetical protein B484DRAFT_482054 [Ochromonadaceae sp. CCMP2298]|nr:hypothetical protein B484DRAFT_482054 [Ochromonadaceae sp. CCMP2298]|mmetsp:Transcript_29974/g.66320  ORF Transcript_29974/g.66320 Transcript_29974/m.66320 type:complete len:448 (-) Transcript_29974:54-1397(-)
MLISSVELLPAAGISAEGRKAVVAFLEHMSILGTVLLQFPGKTNAKQSEDLNYLLSIIRSIPAMVDNLPLTEDTLVTQLLDEGLRVAFFELDPETALFKDTLKTFPKSRVGLTVTDLAVVLDTIKEYEHIVGHFLVKFTDEDVLGGKAVETVAAVVAQRAAGVRSQVYFHYPMGSLSLEEAVRVATLTEDGIHAVTHPRIRTNSIDTPFMASPLLPIALRDLLQFDFAEAFIGCLRTDRPDGMFATVVCDEMGVCLGLVYSTAESIRAAFVEKRGIYWSRSRSSLWRKGDSSGMYQELLGMSYDCDRDALRFSVVQNGTPPAFCHLMSRTCWGPEQGMQKLQSMLQDRKLSAPEGSYTKRLFCDSDLLRKKLLEEVQELMEAETPDHIAAEAADVTYFMMTRCVAAGVTLSDIEAHLDKRSLKISRRPGNAKTWRTAEAEKVLANTA